MSAPDPRARRERLVGLLVLGIAAVLLLSSVTWFGSGRPGVGVGQLVVGLVLAGVGAVVHRRARAR
jgi:hypothetical protein